MAVVVLLLVIGWCGVLAAAGQGVVGQSPTASGHSWSPQVQGALRLYQDGQYADARRACLELLSRAGDQTWRRDVVLLEALCLLRLPTRAERNDGRARLQQLTLEDPTLRDDPECNLAYGVALTALAETADALAVLDSAAERFAARGDARQVEALIALAEAWAAHNEWERTPARFSVPRPADAAAAHVVRRTRIESLRSQIAALAGQGEALGRLDLVLGRYLLRRPDSADEGRELLKRLATSADAKAAGCEAALTLGTDCEQRESWAEAIEWYRHIDGTCGAEAAGRAREAIERLTRAELLLDVPLRVPAAQPIPIGLRCRNMVAVRLEVRQVDVDAWLGSSRTRGSEAGLPESGAVQLARELVTQAETAHDTWDSARYGGTIECAVPPGAYVVLASGRDAGGQTHKRKQLVVVSNLLATCVTGRQQVLVWAGWSGPDNPPQVPIEARFWMNRSFAPIEAVLPTVPEPELVATRSAPLRGQGATTLAMPGEAGVLRDKGWVCLIRAGEHLAVCRGQVPTPGPSETLPQVALLTGPPAPRVGESIYVAGFMLPGESGETGPPIGSRLALTAIDTLERLALTQEVAVSPGGAWGTVLQADAGQVGKHLRVLARLDGQSLLNVLGRPTVSVCSADERQFRVRIEVPAWVSADTQVLRGSVRAEFPWGFAPRQARAECTFDSTLLPVTQDREYELQGTSVSESGRLDAEGRLAFELPIRAFGLPPGPLAIRIRARVSSWEGREGVTQTTVLLGPTRPHAWLTCNPPRPAAHEPVRFTCSWLDPGGLALTRMPTVSVRRDGGEVARLPLRAGTDGLISEAWLPEAGSYDAVVTLYFFDQPPLTLRRLVEVAATEQVPSPSRSLVCRATLVNSTEHAGVRVAVTGEYDGPVLAVLTRSEPLAAAALAVLHERAELLLPLNDLPTAGLRVMLLGMKGVQSELLAVEPVEPDAQAPITLTLQPSQVSAWPGGYVRVRAVASRTASASPPTVLLARLTEASSTGFLDPAAGLKASDFLRLPVWLSVATASGAVRVPPAEQQWSTEPAGVTLPLGVAPELVEGPTLWCMSAAAAGGVADFEVPVPEQPGLYRLVVMARSADGATVTESLLIDARRGLCAALNVPRRMVLGDRTLVAIELENGDAESAAAEVHWELGAGLSAETLHAGVDTSALRAVALGRPAQVTVPAGGRTLLHLEVEAARVGGGQVVVEVRSGHVRRTIAADYEVLEAGSQPGPTAVTLHRHVFVWTKVREGPDRDHGHARRTPPEAGAAPNVSPHDEPEERTWDWVPWQPTDRLVPGQLLKVRDELEVSSELTGALRWSQHVPPTCCTVRGALERAQSRGLVAEPDALYVELTDLKPGLHTQEYYLGVVRPGACELPAPRLHVGDQALDVGTNPPQIRLVVVGGG